jgi:outer membrane protein OmpA-like peptidoglycan-associated protein
MSIFSFNFNVMFKKILFICLPIFTLLISSCEEPFCDCITDTDYSNPTISKPRPAIQLIYTELKNNLTNATIKLSDDEKSVRILIPEILFFKTNVAAAPVVDTIIDVLSVSLKKYDQIQVISSGHTDTKGTDAHNEQLSKARAETGKMLLVNKGITESRIETKWYGDSDPIATNETDAGRAQNRRTEYILYQK